MSTDPNTGRKYIHKVQDEDTKNYKEVDGQIITGFMPEMGNNHPLCPVTSYFTYLYSLNKDNNNLWQASKFTDFLKTLMIESTMVRVMLDPTHIKLLRVQLQTNVV